MNSHSHSPPHPLQVLMMLLQTLKQPQYKGVRLAAGDRALYEQLYRIEPRKYISKPKFLTAMRLVFGFRIAELDRVCDSEVLRHLTDLFGAFDEGGNDRMDWRVFLLMLRVLVDSELSPHEHLLWGFCIYSSVGSFDVMHTSPARLGEGVSVSVVEGVN